MLSVALMVGACGETADNEADERGPMTPTAATSPVPAASPAPGPTPAPTPAVSVAFVQDVKPILDQDCVRCHSEMGGYRGVMGWVRPGDTSSPLVQSTQPGGSMFGHLSGDRAARAELIRRWVVESGAAETR